MLLDALSADSWPKTQFVQSMIQNHEIDWTLNDLHPLLKHEFCYIFKQWQEQI